MGVSVLSLWHPLVWSQALETYKAGLALDEHNEECKEGLQRTIEKINQSQGGEMDSERASKAMADPEIQAIMMDPIVRQTLSDMSTDPTAASKVRLLVASLHRRRHRRHHRTRG